MRRLASRIRAAGDPLSAYLRGAIGSSSLLDGLNAVIAGGALYDAQRFAGVTLGPQTQAALAAGGLGPVEPVAAPGCVPGRGGRSVGEARAPVRE
jgi:hypothetical protein